MDPTLLRT